MSIALIVTSRRAVLAAWAAALAAAVFPMAAQAQDWPSRPVTLVVPFGPGASNDLFTRMLANILQKQFNQPFVVSNRPGAGGLIGSAAVAKSPPDGYLFLEMANSIASFKPIMKTTELDPLTDLAPIGLMARAPTAMVINAGLPVKTVKEFIDYAKARPDQVFYGMAGVGSTNHQHAEMFKAATGLTITGVNYKSLADALADLVAGRLHVVFASIASTRGPIEAGQLRLLAYADSNYPPGSLKAPTMAEAGVQNMEKAQNWWAIFGPAALPADIKAKMNAAINAAVKDPEFAALIARNGGTAAPGTLEDAAEALRLEVAEASKLAKTIKE
jgi:tripartite-type tricarboxylate transporter receptor subunit TctC